MVADGLVAGGLLGILFAGGVAICGATMLVTVRGARDIDMIPALVLAGIFTAGFSSLMVSDFHIPRSDLFWILLLGSGTIRVRIQPSGPRVPDTSRLRR